MSSAQRSLKRLLAERPQVVACGAHDALSARLVTEAGFKAIAIGGSSMLATFLVGVSRVYLGVHYPTDVLAGWCVGLAWALLCWIVARSLQRRGAVEAGPRV